MTLSEVTAELAKRAEEHDREASFPYAGIELVHRHGLLTATVAERYGGEGGGLRRTVDILLALGAGDPAVALVTAMTLFNHAGQALAPAWPEERYRAIVGESAVHPTLINALRVEPELGSPVRGGLPATVATRTADGWSISGRKIFSTGAEALSWMLVWARVDDGAASFAVPGGSPGVAIERTWDHLGLRASRSDDVVLTDVLVPADARLANPANDGLSAWNSLGLTAIYLGVAAAARDWLVRFLHERVPTSLGKPLATLPRFVAAVGEIEARLAGAEVLVRALADGVDAGDPDAVRRAPVGKLLGARAAIESVEAAVALVGNNALTRRNPLERHLRDVLCARIHTPQDDTILTALGNQRLNGEQR